MKQTFPTDKELEAITGIISLPTDFDEKQVIRDILIEKYSDLLKKTNLKTKST